MRKPLPFLLVGLGLAAAGADAQAQYPNLAGAYAGVDLGYNAVGDDVAFSGPFGGAFAGYRLRVADRVYVALEAGAEYAGGSDDKLLVIDSGTIQSISAKRNWALRLDLRPSWQAWGGTQLYGIAGLAYTNFDVGGLSGDDSRLGLRLGLGSEVNFSTTWAIRVEGVHVLYGRSSYRTQAGQSVDLDFEETRFGVALVYRFAL